MGYYEVFVESHVEKRRFKEFAALDVSTLPDGCTRISGELADQTELFSLLNKIRDMNLNLVLVKKLNEEKER